VQANPLLSGNAVPPPLSPLITCSGSRMSSSSSTLSKSRSGSSSNLEGQRRASNAAAKSALELVDPDVDEDVDKTCAGQDKARGGKTRAPPRAKKAPSERIMSVY
jgi:hypothetical protein